MKKYYIRKVTTEEGKGRTNKPDEEMQKLEAALVICGFGRFHVRLLLASLTGFMSASVTTSTSSFILTSAECDLNLNHVQKGILIAAPFMGQVLLSFISGVIADALGRKPCLIFGYCVMCLCCILEGSSQTFYMLLSAKLIAGMALSFCFNGVGTMLAELTHKGLRDKVMLIGMTFSPFTQIMVTVLAWAVLPQSWSFVSREGYFVLHSWNIYLYVCAVFSLLSALQFYYLPESPKYLLAHGNCEKALLNLKKIYHENTGKPMDSFPFTSFTDGLEIKTEKLSFKQHFAGSTSGVKELFSRPLVCPLLLICTIYFICLLTMSTVRLWYPQFSTIIEDYKKEHNDTAKFCTMIDSYFKRNDGNPTVAETVIKDEICEPIITSPETYYNSILVYFMPLVILMTSVLVVNYLGQKLLAFISIVFTSATLSALFWTKTSFQVACVTALSNAFNNAQYNFIASIALRIFPTTSRSLAMSLSLMAGRIGSLVGNVLLPVMLDFGCLAPFGSMVVILLISAVLVCFLPNPSKENKETGDR